MKNALYVSLLGILTLMSNLSVSIALAGSIPAAVHADDSQRKLPFYGKLNAINSESNTITVGKRVFHLTAETKITKDEKPVTLSAEMIGQKVGGSYVKASNGDLHAVSVRVLSEEASGQLSPREKDIAFSP